MENGTTSISKLDVHFHVQTDRTCYMVFDAIRSSLHDVCSLGNDKGGSVECCKTVLSFYEDEKERDALWGLSFFTVSVITVRSSSVHRETGYRANDPSFPCHRVR